MSHFLPIKPSNTSGTTFTTSAPLQIIAWLQSEGFTITRDEPARIDLERDQERISITAAGVITPLGDQRERAARRLLLNSEEST